MVTTYHLTSAQDINADILEAIKLTFKSRPITIIVEEADNEFFLSSEMKTILDSRLSEDQTNYITSEESISRFQIVQ